MEDVDDLDRIGETLVGEGPDPGRAVADDDPAVGIGETAAFGFAAHALGEGGRFAVGIAAGDRLDGGRVLKSMSTDVERRCWAPVRFLDDFCSATGTFCAR